MATTKAKAKEDNSIEDFMEAETRALLKDVEDVVKINAITFSNEERMHTGLLCLDLMTGGGIAPGFYSFAGPEQSAKTTAAITISGASTRQKSLRVRMLWDAENSSGNSLDYIANIYETLGYKTDTEKLFGVRGPKGYIVKPIIEYQDESSGDTFFNWLFGVLKRLPDKRYDNERWWYVFEKTQENKAKYKAHYSVTQSAGKNGLWIPAKDGSLQGLIILDSFPALVPTLMDTDEGSNGMAVQARMFSKHIPRVKGSFRSKRLALIGINQLRLNPGARFSNPEYEPGGEALKFFSDVRFKFFPRALSGVPFKPKGDKGFETEPAYDGVGTDTYRYISVSLIKNKLSPHVKVMWLRLWTQDKNGEGRGYDPVWDTFYYAYVTGQLTGKRHSMRLNLMGLGEATRSITWADFKTLVLGTREDWDPIYKKMGYKTIDMRAGFLRQISSGKGIDAYFQNLAGNTKAEKAEKDEDEDDDAE